MSGDAGAARSSAPPDGAGCEAAGGAPAGRGVSRAGRDAAGPGGPTPPHRPAGATGGTGAAGGTAAAGGAPPGDVPSARTADLGFATVDVGREARQGLPEVIYGPGKTAAQIAGIAATLLERNTGPVLATRVPADTAAAVLAAAPPGGTYDPDARLLVWRPAPPGPFRVAVVSAGTADGPVAAEAAAVARAAGLAASRVDDVGVAGIHRVLAAAPRLAAADAVICVAGMEGALASVVGGLVGAPVVAVPTSTGYGASLEGVTALLAMVSSCAAGLTVVNIDSGFGAAMAVFRIARAAGRTDGRDRGGAPPLSAP